ncbi:MAG: hypothetical protein AAF928_17750, partial [Myxococcota bacterium]
GGVGGPPPPPPGAHDDADGGSYQPVRRYATYTPRPGGAAGSTLRTGALFDEDTYDDTPSIEITGEFEIDPETNWEDLLDPPVIPRDPGPVPNAVIWVAVFVLAFAVYYFFAY